MQDANSRFQYPECTSKSFYVGLTYLHLPVAGKVQKLPAKLVNTKEKSGLVEQNTYLRVMRTMYKQCAQEFSNFPQPKDLEIDNLLFHYELLIPDILSYQKQAQKSK